MKFACKYTVTILFWVISHNKWKISMSIPHDWLDYLNLSKQHDTRISQSNLLFTLSHAFHQWWFDSFICWFLKYRFFFSFLFNFFLSRQMCRFFFIFIICGRLHLTRQKLSHFIPKSTTHNNSYPFIFIFLEEIFFDTDVYARFSGDNSFILLVDV